MMRAMVAGSSILASMLALMLAGCGSVPQEKFYSLSNGLGTPAAGGEKTTLAAPAYYIEVPAVTVPKQAARNQLVVSTGAGRVDVLEQQRWASPPAAEIGQALSLAITGELGTVDVFRAPVPDQSPVYRISTNVQRFESAPGQYALIDAVWSVRKVGSPQVLTCRSVAQETVSAGYDELVAGHRRAVTRIGADISRAIRSLAAGGVVSC